MCDWRVRLCVRSARVCLGIGWLAGWRVFSFLRWVCANWDHNLMTLGIRVSLISSNSIPLMCSVCRATIKMLAISCVGSICYSFLFHLSLSILQYLPSVQVCEAMQMILSCLLPPPLYRALLNWRRPKSSK